MGPTYHDGPPDGGSRTQLERGPNRRGADTTFALAAAAIALAWGLLAAPRGYAEGDASELTLALALAGVPHPTGYPLYTLAGHLATVALHALGVAWPVAANAWSAAGSAVAIFFLARLALSLAAFESMPRTVPAPSAAAAATAVPGLLLLVQPVWTEAATGAEVYSWHAAWAAATAWVAWRLARRGESPAGRDWFGWGLLVGAGLAHHATSIFVSIPFTVWLARRAGPLESRQAGAFAAGTALSLGSLGWIAYRAFHPAAFQWPLLAPGFDGWFAHVTGRTYAGYFGGFNPSPAEMRSLVAALPLLIAVAIAVTGAARDSAGGIRGGFARTLAFVLGAQALFVLAYRVPDPAAHLLPILSLGFVLLPWLALRLARRIGGAVAALAGAALLLLLLPGAVARDLEARAGAEETERVVRAAWESIPFERGVVVWNNDLYARLRAYQLLEGSHPARILAHPGVLSWPGPRRRFEAEQGFDPWNGAPPVREADLARMTEAASRASGLPAVDFDDAIRAIRAGGPTTAR